MHLFLDSSVRPAETRTVVSATPAYVEIQSHGIGRYGGISYTYVTRGDAPASLIVATCWGRDFDQLSDGRAGGSLGTVRRRLPVLGELMANGLERRLDRGALVKMPDPDDEELKWFLALLVVDVDAPTIRALVAHPRLQDACDRVLAQSFVVLQELRAVESGALSSAAL
jgi:hypothetical protein